MRRIARLLRINRKTVARRLKVFGRQCREELVIDTASTTISHFFFDEMETHEHSKRKPISIALAVNDDRRILAINVAEMPAKGVLAKSSVAKYGRRKDERAEKRKELFIELAPLVVDGAIIESDSNPYYPSQIKTYFPNCRHITCIGKRGAATGQGELKKGGYDPLFKLNHTCAMIRDNIKRLARKTWCTTKKKERLADHLAIYAIYHNRHLKKV
jgi:hypothetical protein